MNMGMLLEPMMALSVIFVPLLGCFALVEVQMSRKAIRQAKKMESSGLVKADHGPSTESVNYPESVRTRKYVHLCSICGKRHFINEARHRVAYGKQYSCSSKCESIRRKAWWHSAQTSPLQLDGKIDECHANDIASDCLTTAHVGKLERIDHLRRKQKATIEES